VKAKSFGQPSVDMGCATLRQIRGSYDKAANGKRILPQTYLLVSCGFGYSALMAFQRRLSDHQMIAARWEYQVTSISERDLAAKYGLSRSAIHAWIAKQGWTRARVLRSYEGEEGQKQFQRDVRAAIKAAGDKKIIQALEGALVLPPAGKVTKATKVATPAEAGTTEHEAAAWELSPDQPQSSQNVPFASPPGRRGTGDQGGQVVRFPGASLPPPLPKTNPASAFPSRSRTEQAAMRVHLASLRGELALQQIQQLEQHDELLWDYHHLLRVYLNPSQFVDVAGLDPAQAAARLEAIGRQAGRVVLPTERDTLAGAIQALSKALLASFAAKRNAAGMTPRQMNGRGPHRDEDEQEAPRDLNALDLPSLRSVTTAMALLRGAVQRHDEPPKPPPPEGLEDLLKARRDLT